MKQRFLSILLCLCMVLMLCPMTAFADESYMVTQNFKYGTRTYDGTDPQTSPYQFVIPAGGSFGLATIEDCSPYKLVGWQESVSRTVYPPYAEIQNLQSDLTFDAVYQVQGGLTITVDGFMPGKTPNDCEYTFESTIPGIAFSVDDISADSGGWEYFDEERGRWWPMSTTEVFEAGTRYRWAINLDNKGLTVAPAVTVNGNTPDACDLATRNGVPYALVIGCDFGTPVAPTLAVTVDNFEVGKTPADITYSFASTNLGVTFSEEDILANFGGWEYYLGEVDGWMLRWMLMSNTEVFEAGTRYRCVISLDNKGLTVAPAVTVNGKTPEYYEIATRGGTPYTLAICCEFGTPPEPAITISGPDAVCAEQDYEFSATAAEGAAISYFHYRCGEYGGYTGWSRIEDGVYYGTVPASEYGDADSMELTVTGTAANGRSATATKTVQISKEHIFVGGVCGCGAKPEYTITYDGGEGVEGSIEPDIKADGVPVTLSGKTFTRDGYVQTGWIDKEGAVYELGATYTEDRDVTLSPVWEKLITVTADFTTKVELGDVGEPGETTFELAVIGDSAPDMDKSDVTITGSVTTNGKGSYDGTLTISGPEKTIWYMLSEGAFVQQVNAGEAGWTYDDTVWGLLLEENGIALLSLEDEPEYILNIYPTICEEANDGTTYYCLDQNAGTVEKMSFTNIYTKKAANQTESNSVKGTKPNPQTGDNSNLFLWIALLFAGGFGVIGTGAYSKHRRSTRAK